MLCENLNCNNPAEKVFILHASFFISRGPCFTIEPTSMCPSCISNFQRAYPVNMGPFQTREEAIAARITATLTGTL